ncbi:hypothetical protein K3N28_07445 [Glycomyces sp. TRM65418]|uniref:hypothetical protein n=1 Tax=Glycomyces sp. TRM65418 TaxID=2867006 RepID=UPI001CE5D8EB|nr:hypothetical protein [Glycomyces sp. TRM65418]MCC3762905.1 hypothetical protein [Glycomyces sp. TRM65418]QZD56930.1 hypothetical protein K3N28_07395 [Glycomyces sp. TRM65418]
MSNRSRTAPAPDPLERGRFTDGHTDFTVRASTIDAPDSFQVSADDNLADIVLIVSGLNSGDLHATWGQGWRAFNPEWKVWVEDVAFKVFYTGHHITDRPSNRPGSGDGGPGPVKFCNG